jgi:hypothetical protein
VNFNGERAIVGDVGGQVSDAAHEEALGFFGQTTRARRGRRV